VFSLTLIVFGLGTISAQAAPKRKARAAYNSALKKAKSGDMSAAIDLFAKAVQIDARYAMAWRDLGLALRYKNRYVEAAAAYERAVANKKKDGKGWHKLGETYLDLSVPDRAVIALRNALKHVKKKKRGEVKRLLARALSRAGKYKDAIGHYKTLIAKSGSDKALLIGLANAQAKADKYAAAVKTLKKVIALNPREKKAHILMAQCYAQLDKKAKARTSYAAACELGDRQSCLKSR